MIGVGKIIILAVIIHDCTIKVSCTSIIITAILPVMHDILYITCAHRANLVLNPSIRATSARWVDYS